MNPEKLNYYYIELFNAVLTEAGDSALFLEQNPSSFSLPESSPSEVQIWKGSKAFGLKSNRLNFFESWRTYTGTDRGHSHW